MKEEIGLLFLHELKFGHKSSQIATNINRAWGEGSTWDRTLWSWILKSRNGDTILENHGW